MNGHATICAQAAVRLGQAAMRPILMGVLVGIFLILPSPTGVASACEEVEVIGGDGGVATELQECEDAAPDAGDGDETPASTPTSDGEPLSVRVGTVDEDGQPCLGWDTVWLEEPHHAHQALADEVIDLNAWMADNGFHDEGLVAEGRLSGVGEDLLPDCPPEQGIDPQVVRDLVVHELPVPNPTSQPDWALTGMPTYLEIGSSAEYEETLTGDVLPVSVTVSGQASFHVDWGDGTETTHDSAGGPYPDGDVVHTYATAVEDGIEIVVTPVWELEWSAAGLTMPLEVTLEPATYELPVRELQAVRSSSH